MIRSVCIDARDLPPGVVNGTGVYAVELVRHLPAAIEVSALVAHPEVRRVFEGLGARVVEQAGSCDVFHRPSQIYQPASLETFLHAPGRAVITYHDLISYRTPALFGTPELHRRYCALSFASLRAAAAVIAVSEHGRREIVDEFALPPGKVHAIHNGVDAEFFAAPRPRPFPSRYFFCSGSDYPHKNLGLLLRGYAWLRAQWKSSSEPVPELVLVGQRTGAPGVYELGPEPAPGVHYLGTVDREKLPALYQHALAFVYPSSYEGFGLPVLEAMAAGTPVVCARLTSVPEVAGEAALYLEDLSMDELAARMLALASDAALRSRLIALGRERVKRFTWTETARRTAEVYAAASADDSQRRELAALMSRRTARG